MKSKKISAAFLLAAVLSGFAVEVFACGPFFPNNLLDGGDHAVLQPPMADFQRELERMNLATTKWRAVTLKPGQQFRDQSAALEMNDLAAALKKEKISSEQAIVIMQAHLAERMKLNSFIAAQNEWETFQPWAGYPHLSNTNPPPVCPAIAVTPGLPREFALYFEGAIDWHTHQRWPVEPWQGLLALPPGERHFKSVWAAFMLGKFNEMQTNDWDDREALKYFAQVRTLAAGGFADSAGLATASLGEEARIYLRRGDFAPAIGLYLEQLAAGDAGAAESLRRTASAIFATNGASPEQLIALAKDPRCRRTLTAYLISRQTYCDDGIERVWSEQSTTNPFRPLTAWLKAVEAANVQDVEFASQFALAAYQANDIDAAQHWINRARNEPVAQWLQAKLLMRAGKIDAAAKLLAKVSRQFPQQFPDEGKSRNFAENLSVNMNEVEHDYITTGQQALGELGVLHLARREYVEALDALARSGYWMDAAYVGERVLTTDELKNYVDRNWRAVGSSRKEAVYEDHFSYGDQKTSLRTKLRYLLARRVTRDGRYAAAKDYFPGEWQPRLDALAAALKIGHDSLIVPAKRADALMAAAFITRTNGMELMGTELAPDWFIEEGNFESGVTWQDREATRSNAVINVASADEITRATNHCAVPEERWHYRVKSWALKVEATEMMWQAAQSMPNNSDELVQMLMRAGNILKDRDPPAADRFYKALVNRCRKTAIGQEADRIRWFPKLDADGNLKKDSAGSLSSVEPEPTTIAPGPTNSVPATIETETTNVITAADQTYIVHAGDTLAAICKAHGVALRAMLAANPGLNAKNLHVGQVLRIPQSPAGDAR